ncbi:hypothetical protein ACHAXS_000219, partial [Conticribra weissflogii]
MAQSSNDHDQQLQQIREQYSSQKVISDAEAKLAEAGINAAQNVYQSAILDWVDDVTMGMDPEEEEEGGKASHGSGNAVLGPEAVTSSGARVVTKRDIIRGEIVELWLGYANLNRRANLYQIMTVLPSTHGMAEDWYSLVELLVLVSEIRPDAPYFILSFASPSQFKSATEVYEQATNCAVAGRVGKIWLEYARFLEERGRPRTAQKIYLRALVGEGG